MSLDALATAYAHAIATGADRRMVSTPEKASALGAVRAAVLGLSDEVLVPGPMPDLAAERARVRLDAEARPLVWAQAVLSDAGLI